MRIGEVMLEMKVINKNQLEIALDEQERNLKESNYSEPLGNLLLRKGIITEHQLNMILINYFECLIQDDTIPKYVRETAKVACDSLKKKKSKISEEGKMIILKKIQEYEEKIEQYEKSVETLSNLEQNSVIRDTIRKEMDEIDTLLKRVETLKDDLINFS